MENLESYPFGTFLSDIAKKTPAPGGGAVAPAVGAIAAALAEMVVAYSLGKASLAEHQETLTGAAERLGRARSLLLKLAEEDAAAYEWLNRLMRLPEGDPGRAEMRAAVSAAIAAPRASLAGALDLLRLLEKLVSITNRRLRTDLAIAAVLAEAAARAAAWNVRINLPLIEDARLRADLDHEASDSIREARERAGRVEAATA